MRKLLLISFVLFSLVGNTAWAGMIAGRFGTKFNDYLSGEIRIAYGAGSDSVTALGQEVDVKLNRMYGIYLRGGFPASDYFYPYVALGLSNGKVTASVNGFSASDSESDNSFGIGAEFEVGEDQIFNFEYMSYLDKNGVEINGFSLGFISYF